MRYEYWGSTSTRTRTVYDPFLRRAVRGHAEIDLGALKDRERIAFVIVLHDVAWPSFVIRGADVRGYQSNTMALIEQTRNVAARVDTPQN
jgi:hypothetical protein